MSNRPLFDDEDLPAWLKNAGITYGSGEGQAAPESSTPSASPGSDDLSWLDEGVQSTPGGALPFDANVPWDSSDSSMTDTISAAPDWMKDLQASPASPEPAPWMQSAVPEEDTSSTSASNREESLPWEDNSTDESTTAPAGFGTTGALPWRQDVSDPADQPSATSSELSWLDEAPATESAPAEPSSSSETLAWQQEPADDVQLPSGSTDAASWVSAGPPTLPKPPTSEPPAITDDDLSWLSEAAPAEPAAELPISQVPVEPTAPTSEPPAITDDDLSWLSEAAPAEPAAPPAEAPRPAIRKLPTANQPPAESAAPPAEAPRPAIRKLPTANQPPAEPAAPPAEDAPRPAIRRLPTANQPPAQPSKPAPDFSNMTYEQWEQAQAQAEQEAQADPADQLLDEVPDWFKGADAPAAASAATPSGEFMPEWFVGQEEQSPDAAPDWFSNADFTNTPLVGPETIQNVAATPDNAPAAPTSEDVPDWFKGSVAGVDDLDFNSMFVSETPPEESKSTGSLAAKLAELTPEQPPAAPIEATEPEAQEPPLSVETSALAQPAVPELEPVDVAESEPGAPIEMESTAENIEAMNAESELVAPVELSSAFDEPSIDELTVPAEDTSQADSLDWLDMPDLDDLTGTMKSQEPAAVTEPEPTAESEAVDDRLNILDNVTAAEPSAVTEPQADLAPAEDVPDWMREMQADVPPIESSASTEPQADVPDWMREMAPVPSTPIAAPTEGQQEFDWLTDFDPSSGTVAPAETASQSEQSAEQLVTDEVTAPTSAAPGVDIDALLSFAETASPPQATTSDEPAADEFDFETELEPVAPTTPAAPTSDQLDATTLDFDALLAAATDTSAAPTVLEPPAPAEPIAPPAPAPSRLRRLPKTSEVPAVPQAPSQEAAPEWVEAMKPASGPVVLRIGDQEVRAEERPANILPEELQRLRERARAFAQRPAAPASTAGPLAGITGAIEAIPEPVQPITSAGAASLIVSDLDARRIRLIQNILGVEEQMLQERIMSDEEREAKQAAAGIKPAAPTRPRPKIDRIAISILLALAIIAPFFTSVLNVATLPDTTQLSPVQTSVKTAIEAIPADQDVLVAFEYGPTGAGELDDLARAIVRDIVKQGAHPVVVSTNPTGALHAQALMQSLATRPDELGLMNRTDKPLVVRKDYWVLPYLPGGAIGVRSLLNAVLKSDASQLAFKTDIEGVPSGLTNVSITTLQRNPTFILTESQEDVRNWVEQYQAAPPNQVKLVLLSSAAASAVAQTYVSTSTDQHIIGPLVGLRDAISYQGVRQPLPAGKAAALLDQRWQSIGLATLLAALIILAGAAFNVIRGLQRRTHR